MIRHAASVSGEDGGNPMAALMAAAAGKKRKTDHQAQPKAVDPWGGHAVSLSSLQPAEEAIETDTSKPLGPEPKEDYKYVPQERIPSCAAPNLRPCLAFLPPARMVLQLLIHVPLDLILIHQNHQLN